MAHGAQLCASEPAAASPVHAPLSLVRDLSFLRRSERNVGCQHFGFSASQLFDLLSSAFCHPSSVVCPALHPARCVDLLSLRANIPPGDFNLSIRIATPILRGSCRSCLRFGWDEIRRGFSRRIVVLFQSLLLESLTKPRIKTLGFIASLASFMRRQPNSNVQTYSVK